MAGARARLLLQLVLSAWTVKQQWDSRKEKELWQEEGKEQRSFLTIVAGWLVRPKHVSAMDGTGWDRTGGRASLCLGTAAAP